METGYYKSTDTGTPTADWIRLNFDQIPTALIAQLCKDNPDKLQDMFEQAEPLTNWPVAQARMFLAHFDQNIAHFLQQAGFTVYKPVGLDALDGLLIFGIDGGGYDFTAKHWAPLRASIVVHHIDSMVGHGKPGRMAHVLQFLAAENPGAHAIRTRFGHLFEHHDRVRVEK